MKSGSGHLHGGEAENPVPQQSRPGAEGLGDFWSHWSSVVFSLCWRAEEVAVPKEDSGGERQPHGVAASASRQKACR